MSFFHRITALAAAGVVLAAAGTSSAVTAYALNDNNSLLGFDTATPSSTFSAVFLKSPSNTAIQDIIGIDFRPATGQLYGVGNLGAVYTIDPTTGVSTQVATLQADPTDASFVYTGLNGSRFGLDFNPVVDRLRITSDADQNLRINVANGFTTTDTTLTNGSPNANIVASAYSNSFNGAATTTLYAIDTVTDTLYSTANANGGVYTAVGPLGFDATALSGFDIGPGNVAYAALLPATESGSKLYVINLATGAATPVAGNPTIGGGDFADGLAIVIPEPTAIAALAGAGLLFVRRRRGA